MRHLRTVSTLAPVLWRFARSVFLHGRPKSSGLAEPVVGVCCAVAPMLPILFALLRSIAVRLVVVLALILSSFLWLFPPIIPHMDLRTRVLERVQEGL